MSVIRKIGVLKETKEPHDFRVPLTPNQVLDVKRNFPNVEIVVQESDIRCFRDEEYSSLGIDLVKDVSDCDLLVGVKEVAIPKLMSDKKYLFFSHTAKEQEYNKELLQTVLRKKITLVDYEYLVNEKKKRLIAFGRWAGIVGCYNGIIAFGKKHSLFDLPRAYEVGSLTKIKELLSTTILPNNFKAVVTGSGRVAKGAEEILKSLNVVKVNHEEFTEDFDCPVYTVLKPKHYAIAIDETPCKLKDFKKHPQDYKSNFMKYIKGIDLLVSSHFWDNRAPKIFELEDIKNDDFNISVIADVTCDINGSIPTTTRPTTIDDPYYGFDVNTHQEVGAFDPNTITVMAVDNLPGELPKDASDDFGTAMSEIIIPELLSNESEVIKRATIADSGSLGDYFQYLEDFAS